MLCLDCTPAFNYGVAQNCDLKINSNGVGRETVMQIESWLQYHKQRVIVDVDVAHSNPKAHGESED